MIDSNIFKKFEPYSRYKSSGVEWLGNVPAHWELRRTKTLLAERSKKGFPDKPLLAATQTKGVVRKEYYESRTVLAMKDLHLLKVVNRGDFVISLRSFQGGIEYARDSGIISPAYTILYPVERIHHAYLSHVFKSKSYITNLSLFVTGIRQGQNIDYEELARSSLPLPPLPEQHAIVCFLDHAGHHIRRYIDAKQRLIGLLEEHRRAIIQRAVTRGLNPDVSLKDSGVGWLGEVPEHWKVMGLKYLSRCIQNGITPPTAEPRYYENGTIPWYGPSSCRYQEEVDSPVRHLTVDAFREGKARLISKPALLVVVIGATAGRMALLMRDGSTNQQITSFELNTTLVNPLFILRQLRNAEDWLHATASTATIPILDTGVVSRLSVAFPSLSEQHVIVEYLDKATASIDTAIDRTRRQIELMEEYRTRLISDVVTGKIDVREAVAQLPEQPKEVQEGQ